MNLNALQDVFLGHIFPFLTIEDVLSFRKASKFAHNLTRHGSIWKRFLRILRCLDIPIPALPPDCPEIGDLDAVHAERLVVQALTMEENWRSHAPEVYRQTLLPNVGTIFSMSVTPGGKYMVASVRNCGAFYLVLFLLESVSGRPQMLYTYETTVKAYDIQLMTHVGAHNAALGATGTIPVLDRTCLVIAYFTRDFSRRRSKVFEKEIGKLPNPSRYAGNSIEPPVRLNYSCTCIRVPLRSLESLSMHMRTGVLGTTFSTGTLPNHGSIFPGSGLFSNRVQMTSHLELAHLSLLQMDGDPCVAFVQNRDTIVIRNFEKEKGRRKVVLKCTKGPKVTDELSDSICALRVLAPQRPAVVMRRIVCKPTYFESTRGTVTVPNNRYPYEVYQLPHDTEVYAELDPVRRDFLPDDFDIVNVDFPRVYISDPGAHRYYQDPTRLPLTISLVVYPNEFRHLVMFPDMDDEESAPAHSSETGQDETQGWPYPVETYPVKKSRLDWNYVTEPHFFRERLGAIPGTYRTLLCNTRPHWDNAEATVGPIRAVGFTQDAQRPERDERAELLALLTGSPRRERERGAVCVFCSAKTFWEMPQQGHDVTAVAWDEGIGRLCVSLKHDGSLHVFEFSRTPRLPTFGSLLPL